MPEQTGNERANMTEQIKVSVIMPVYKVEDYVGRAIESIQAQTLKEFEFLIVDDGTPDKSGEICDAYAKEDSRITVFHKENGGAPSARNLAMDCAKGKYLYFMDSDDWAEPTMLQDMYEIAERDQAQLVVAGFYIDTYYDDDKFRRDDFKVDDMVFSDGGSFHRDAYKLFDKNQLYSPWNKLWQREYIEEGHFRFPATFWDDFPFILSVIRDVEKVSVTSKQYYHFIRARAESETAAYRPAMYEKREEEHGWMKELYRHWGVNDEASREMVARRYIERFIGCLENLTNPNCTMEPVEKRALVKKMILSKNVRWSLKLAKPRTKMMAIMLVPLKLKNVSLTLLEAKVITCVKTRSTRLFAALKAGR